MVVNHESNSVDYLCEVSSIKSSVRDWYHCVVVLYFWKTEKIRISDSSFFQFALLLDLYVCFVFLWLLLKYLFIYYSKSGLLNSI
jgi:uncharacterized membrane protein